MLNEEEKKQLSGIASLGRNEDTQLAHVAVGEMIVPPQAITPSTKRMIQQDMLEAGVNPNRYVVGGDMSINPQTGLPEFFLKKLKKGLSKLNRIRKKAVKTLAPIAVNFIPGIGPVASAALTAGIGKATGMSTKDALLSGVGSFLGSRVPKGGGQSFFQRAKEYVLPGQDKVGLLGNLKKGVGSFFTQGGKYNPITGQGQSRLGRIEDFLKRRVTEQLTPGSYPEGYQTVSGQGMMSPQDYLNQFQGGSQIINGVQVIQGKDGQYYPYDQVRQQYDSLVQQSQGGFMPTVRRGQSQGGFLPAVTLDSSIIPFPQQSQNRPPLEALRSGAGSFFGFKTPRFIKGIEDAIKGPKGGGRFFGRRTPEFIRGIEDKLKGGVQALNPFRIPEEGAGPLIDPAIAALAVGYGKLVKEAAERQSGGMEDIRQSLRPDLAQPATFGGGMGFDVGLQRYNQGGEVLDMRDGGESEGPGTGTSDDIPAMLSDGEFVMTAKAVRGAGAFEVEPMDNGIMLVAKDKASREKGSDNMMTLMRTFENYG